MKAQNNREVIRAIVRFSAYLLASVTLAVCAYASFMKTSVVEVQKIQEKSDSNNALQIRQVIMTESVDTMYYYAMLINSDSTLINQPAMFNMLSTKNIRFSEDLETVNGDDVMVYRRLSIKIGDIIGLKDSIRTAKLSVDILRDEYLRCITKNREMTRRLFTGSVY